MNCNYFRFGGTVLSEKFSFIGKNLSILHRTGKAFILSRFEEKGYGDLHPMFWGCIYKHEGINQEELSSILQIDKGATARAIKKMENGGFVRREKDIDDKRAYKIYLTQKSKEIQDDIFSIYKEWEEIITEDFADDEIKTLNKLLNKAIDKTSKYRHNKCKCK